MLVTIGIPGTAGGFRVSVGGSGPDTSSSGEREQVKKHFNTLLHRCFHLYFDSVTDRGPSQHQPTAGLLPPLLPR